MNTIKHDLNELLKGLLKKGLLKQEDIKEEDGGAVLIELKDGLSVAIYEAGYSLRFNNNYRMRTFNDRATMLINLAHLIELEHK